MTSSSRQQARDQKRRALVNAIANYAADLSPRGQDLVLAYVIAHRTKREDDFYRQMLGLAEESPVAVSAGRRRRPPAPRRNPAGLRLVFSREVSA